MDWLNNLLAKIKAGMVAAAEWTAEKLSRGIWWVIDNIPGDTHPAIKTVLALLVLAFVGVAGSFLLAGLAFAQPATHQVIGHRCDKHGGVDMLQIIVIEPQVVTLSWDNKAVCGKAV